MAYLDTRVQYTTSRIKDSFIHILSEKSISRITVKEVCDAAKINRSTFYYYYKDCFDLLDKIVNEVVERALCYEIESEEKDLLDVFSQMLSDIKEDSFLFYTLGIRDSDFMTKVVDACFKQTSMSSIHRILKNSESHEKELFYYISFGCCGVIINWVRSGMQESISDLAKLLVKLVQHARA